MDGGVIAGQVGPANAAAGSGAVMLADSVAHYRFNGAMQNASAPLAPDPQKKPPGHNGISLKIIEPPNRQQVTAAIAGLQHEMRAGRSYLVNYCSQTDVEVATLPAALFAESTAPFTVWLENEFISFSPEAFIAINGNSVSTNPMKGTGGDADQLLADAKEQAEHATVVDLLRSDLSQVASGVRVTDYRYLTRIDRSTGPLYQTSTRISGTMPDNWRATMGEWLPRLLPAGSISGAPKQETVGLIREFETEPRGFFTGIAVLFDGENLQSAVLIRYLDLSGPQLKFRSGAGITIYSDPVAEYDEIISKVYIPL